MEFIKQNWWYFLIVSVFGYMMLRKGGGGCCGHSHGANSGPGHTNRDNEETNHDQHMHTEKISNTPNTSKMVKDPVCGMDVDSTSALSATVNGTTYYFCSIGCKREFTGI